MFSETDQSFVYVRVCKCVCACMCVDVCMYVCVCVLSITLKAFSVISCWNAYIHNYVRIETTSIAGCSFSWSSDEQPSAISFLTHVHFPELVRSMRQLGHW